jgi:hypothetical protein
LENGENENTTVSFSDDVIIDKTLKKGKYSLYTNPKIESCSFSTRLLITGEQRSGKKKMLNPLFFTVVTPTFLLWENSMLLLKFEVPTQKSNCKH